MPHAMRLRDEQQNGSHAFSFFWHNVLGSQDTEFEMTIQGMSFYDFIGKLVPGMLIWTPILKWVYEPGLTSDVLWIIAAFTGFYITGLIWSYIIMLITSGLRHNKNMLVKAYKKVYNNIQKINSEADAIPITADNASAMYIEAYTKAQMNNTLGNVPLLEAQENFVKNVWLLLFYYIIVIHCYSSGFEVLKSASLITAIIIAIIAIPIIWYKTQMKIYELIWESDAYITKIQEQQKQQPIS